jgi:16S rRNA (cytidine1402-2'-O)-methyltransferase
METGKLTLIPTPIGNLEDITLRAIRILSEVDVLLAEDTRHTGKLLQHLEIQTKLESLHQHNEHQKVASIIQRLKNGLQIGYCSDAGTPGISDPGFLLVREALAAGIPVECLPGPVAFIPALVACGIPCDRFVFEGFLPQKKGRQKRLLALHNEHRTMVFYESPHRIEKLLTEFQEHFGRERQVCLARELTKLHEEYIRGSVHEVQTLIQSATLKGEFVVILAGA